MEEFKNVGSAIHREIYIVTGSTEKGTDSMESVKVNHGYTVR